VYKLSHLSGNRGQWARISWERPPTAVLAAAVHFLALGDLGHGSQETLPVLGEVVIR
jgi:hypothetical protein